MKANHSRGWRTVGAIGVGLVVLIGLTGCERQPPRETQQETLAPTVQVAPAEKLKTEMAAADVLQVFMAPDGSVGPGHNEEGVTHAEAGHWEAEEGDVRHAVEADSRLARAQFNLGLALEKLGKHDEAKAAFERAAEQGAGTSKFTEFPVLKKHTST